MKGRESQVQEELKLWVCVCVSVCVTVCLCVRVSVMDLGYQTENYCALQEIRLTTIQSTADSSNNRTRLICVSEGARERNRQE